ncbi:hypothetical protein H6A04_12270, partial [Fusobacterium mortiferum]|nr:hypothetical protein [Fusobacterium mortiferum]
MNAAKKERDIIKNIKVLAKELGKTPTKRDYLKKYGNPQFENIGGFSLMLEKVGYVRNKHNNLNDEDIKRIFKEYIKKNGVPISHKFPKTLPSYDLVCSRFKSLLKKMVMILVVVLAYQIDLLFESKFGIKSLTVGILL